MKLWECEDMEHNVRVIEAGTPWDAALEFARLHEGDIVRVQPWEPGIGRLGDHWFGVWDELGNNCDDYRVREFDGTEGDDSVQPEPELPAFRA